MSATFNGKKSRFLDKNIMAFNVGAYCRGWINLLTKSMWQHISIIVYQSVIIVIILGCSWHVLSLFLTSIPNDKTRPAFRQTFPDYPLFYVMMLTLYWKLQVLLYAAVLMTLIFPFDIFFLSSRFFFLRTVWRIVFPLQASFTAVIRACTLPKK